MKNTKYKHTEVGIIPEDWDVKAISEFSNLVRGGSPRPAGDLRYFNGNFIPWLTVAALTNLPVSQIYVSETETYLTQEGSFHSRILDKDTLIIANSGATLGVAKLLSIKCCANDGIAALLDVDKNINKQFLVYYINTKIKYLREVIATGNGQPNLNTDLIGNIKIPLPHTNAEQTSIATTFSDTDALISSLEKLIAKKRAIKQGAMQELLKPKEGWEMKKLGEIAKISGGYSATRDQLSNEGYCYLHYGDIHGATKTYIDVGSEFSNIPKLPIQFKNISKKSLLENGDVVFVDASEDDEGVSRHVVIINEKNIPFISGLHTIVVKSFDDSLLTNYKRYCFQTRQIKEQFKFYAVGTKVSGISKSNIVNISLTIPPKSEQTRIATILSEMDADIDTLSKKLEKYKKIKQGMMQNLLTGKIRLV